MLSDKWRPARRTLPCPVCGKPDWCQISADGQVAICRRVTSNNPSKGGGWIHRIGGVGGARATSPSALSPAGPAVSSAPPPQVHRHDFDHLARSFHTAVNPWKLSRFAVQLGVSVDALMSLGVGWSHDHRAWAFPMRTHLNQVTGIRMRAVNGKKFSITGGREGLFVPHGGGGGEDRLFVCEGPTDCAALLDMDLPAVGRPSCLGGVPLLTTFIKARFIARLIIVADGDGPGQQGALQLAQRARPYCRDVRLITPPAGIKDARAWRQQGAGAADVEQLVAAAPQFRLSVTSPIQSKTPSSMEGVRR